MNRALANPLLVVGVEGADAARYGTPDDAFNWAADEDLRADAKTRIEHWRCEAQWTHTRLELSGARGLEVPPPGLTPVFGHRWVLEVVVPPSDSAQKRRRFSAVHVAPRTRPRRAAPGPPTAGTPGSDASQN